jgi:hypothetical protein
LNFPSLSISQCAADVQAAQQQLASQQQQAASAADAHARALAALRAAVDRAESAEREAVENCAQLSQVWGARGDGAGEKFGFGADLAVRGSHTPTNSPSKKWENILFDISIVQFLHPPHHKCLCNPYFLHMFVSREKMISKSPNTSPQPPLLFWCAPITRI